MCLPHALHSHYWTLDDNMPQLNKTDGLVVMISLLIAREFRFDFEFVDKEMKEVLEAVNKKRETLNVSIRRYQRQRATNA